MTYSESEPLIDQSNEDIYPSHSNILVPEDFHGQEIEFIKEFTNTPAEQASNDYLSEYYQEDLYLFEKAIQENINQLINENGDDENLAEFLPALLPIITAVAPTIIKGVASVISNARNRRKPPVRPQVQRPQPRPAAQKQQQPRSQPVQRPEPQPRPHVSSLRQAPVSNEPVQSPTPTSRSATGQRARVEPTVTSTNPTIGTAPIITTADPGATANSPVSQLLNLLNNPSILNLIQRTIGGGGAESVVLGPDQVEVSLGSVLNAISEYAQRSQEFLEQEGLKEIPEYLIDAEGNFKCDIYSPKERAEVLMELINEEN